MRKFFRWFSLTTLAIVLVGPFLVPVNTSGNRSKELRPLSYGGTNLRGLMLATSRFTLCRPAILRAAD